MAAVSRKALLWIMIAVVVVVIVMLAVPNYVSTAEDGPSSRQADLRSVATALELYRLDFGDWPDHLDRVYERGILVGRRDHLDHVVWTESTTGCLILRSTDLGEGLERWVCAESE